MSLNETHFIGEFPIEDERGLVRSLCGVFTLRSNAAGAPRCTECWLAYLRIERELLALIEDTPSLTAQVMLELQRSVAAPVRES